MNRIAKRMCYVSLIALGALGSCLTCLTSCKETCRVFQVNGVKFRMVPVKASTFSMGATPEQQGLSDWETPVHQVVLTRDYYIGQTEVTQALWEAVMNQNPSANKGANLPVESVSWLDCQQFIHTLDSITGLPFRLPTEAEWEFAARGGTKGKGFRFSGSNQIDEVAWYDGNSQDMTHPVMEKKPNELGTYDMSGNVWEWCSDGWGHYADSIATDPLAAPNSYSPMNRGGSAYRFEVTCQTAFRSTNSNDYADTFIGLRLALDMNTDNSK